MSKALVALVAAFVVLAGCSGKKNVPPPTAGAGAASGAAGGLGAAGIDSSGLGGPVQPGTQQDLEVNVGDTVLFSYDSAVLDDVAQETLRRQAAWLNQYPQLVVTIEGHTDDRGTREYNLALGERRAIVVREYLVALEVEPSRVLTISYGEERPANPLANEQAWAENRRADTQVNVSY
jgi:peptidoglycan-associated lipoprotein